MPDLAEFFRWQWMWRSRPRLIAIAVGAILFGCGWVVFGIFSPGPMNKGKWLIVICGLMFALLGGYQLLQGVLSPAGAFGNHEKEDPTRRTLPPAPRPKRKRQDSGDRPIPIASDTAEAAPPPVVWCPVCEGSVALPVGTKPTAAVECPRCLERFKTS